MRYVTGEVLRVEPLKVLEYKFGLGDGAVMSRVKVELTPETEAVKVVVTNDDWQEGDPAYAQNAEQLPAGAPNACARESLKSGLPKVPVRGDRMRQTRLVHHDKARTVSEREIFVAILKKQEPCPLKSIRINAFPPHSGASIELRPPALGRVQSEADSQKR
jgi:hypothetical protein